MKKKKIIIIVVCIVVALCCGIGVAVAINHKSDNASTSTTPKKVTKTTSDAVSRLTGLPIDESLANKRPFAIMVENTTSALPQYGLNTAGVIYECQVEGGITRLMAIFDDYSKLDKIGNVRSCRPYYAYIASEYDAVYVHFGQSVQGKAVLDSGIVNDLNGLDGSLGSKVFIRADDRKAPHNAYTSPAGLAEGVSIKGYSTDYSSDDKAHFMFSSKANKLSKGTACAVVSLYFYNNKPYFIYDSKSGLYQRYEFGNKQIDAVDNKQIAVKNIILQDVNSSLYEGTPYLNIPLVGSGDGKYITNGKVIDITWKKDSDKGITHYYYQNGDELQLNPGQTWVSLVENAGIAKNTFYATEEEYTKK